MGRRGVAVQVEGAGGFEHAVQFDQAGGHHGEVGHHVVGAQKIAQGLENSASFLVPLVTTSRKICSDSSPQRQVSSNA